MTRDLPEWPRLIALDLDGTLLPESKQLTERSRRILAEMEARGTVVTLVTGKFLHLALHYGAALELQTPLIALDGARVAAHGREGVEERCIAPETAAELLDEFDDGSWSAFADDGADVLLVRSRRHDLSQAVRPWADRIEPVAEIAGRLTSGPGILAFYGEESEMEELHRRLVLRFPQLRVGLFHSALVGCSRVTVQPGGVSKGSGLEALLVQLGIEPEACLAFGDWLNDLHMFEVGCVNVAMANAVAEVKAAAHHFTRYTCEEDGVARFLELHYL